MNYDDIKDQLERYGGLSTVDVLPVLEAITDLNDDLAHMRSHDCILESVEKIKERLDILVAGYR